MLLPKSFLNHAKKFVGDDFDAFIKSLSDVPPVSIRLNPFKKIESFANTENIPWSIEGRYLEKRPSFTNDPLFHAGCYYVQDASSQFLEQAIIEARKNLHGPLRFLDLCAAPGGKSTHILSLIDKEDLLVSNEIIPSRNNILRQNIMKWGVPNVIVTQNKPDDFRRLDNFFDIIVVDAPCSGEGLFRKDPEAISEWSEENVLRCIVRQEEILEHAWKALRPGGYLIYSTCTFEEEENDKQIVRLCNTYDILSVKIGFIVPGISETKNGLAFFPHRIRGEGFFISLMKKNGSHTPRSNKQMDNYFSNEKKYLESFLDNANDFVPVLKDDRLFAIPVLHFNDYNYLHKNLYVRLAGIYMGDFKGNNLIPSAALALSCRLKTDFSLINLDSQTALQYLRGIDVRLEANKGWCLVGYNNFPLGWIKNLGARINNYYPKEWRIRI